VFIDETIHRNGRVYFRCHADETLNQRAVEIPDWMFESTCSTIGAAATPVVSCDALRNLKALLASASGHDPVVSRNSILHVTGSFCISSGVLFFMEFKNSISLRLLEISPQPRP